MDKKIKYYVNVHFYFKVHDSKMFGGEGTVGYTSASFNGCTAFSEEKVNETYEDIVYAVAGQLNVDVSKIECVTKEEYDSFDEEDE
ncbi:MAG: hypothetical protein K2H01_08050 [Ruminococcus sp.]|nr:hypothetical protein [Ruminococcus sp.]